MELGVDAEGAGSDLVSDYGDLRKELRWWLRVAWSMGCSHSLRQFW